MSTWQETERHDRPSGSGVLCRVRRVAAWSLTGALALAAWGGGAVSARGQGVGPSTAAPGRDLGRPVVTRDLTANAPPAAASPLPGPLPATTAQPLPGVPGPALPVPPPPLPEVPPGEVAANRALQLPIPPQPLLLTADSSRYIKQPPGADNAFEIIVGRLQVFNLQGALKRVQIGDETVANYALLSTTEMSLQGLRVGSTVFNLWFRDLDDPNKTKMISFLVRVLPDPDARQRLERAYKNLEKEINRVFPDSKIYLTLVGDKLAVCGQAKDIAEANMIMRMVTSNVLPETADAPDLSRPAAADPINQVNRILPASHRHVINMIRVPGEQQVMLQVQVVEVDRAAARSIGLNFSAFRRGGGFFVGGTTGNLAGTGVGNGTGQFAAFDSGFGRGALAMTGLGGLPNLPVALDNGQIQLAIAALRNLSYARYLAEPNLVAINGQRAAFQVGGLLPIPVVTGNGFNNLQGVNFIPTGVQLSFTPFITDRDRVRLAINAEISDRDLNIAPTFIEGAAVPTLVTRNFTTTVELREGQTLAVAGLIESKLDTDSTRLPLLSCIPILGRLAGYDRTGNRELELVILVTPRLVHPLECPEVPNLPGHDLLEPTDFEFYLLGRLESHTGLDYRSPIRTDKSRKDQFRMMEQTFLCGPTGPSIDLPGGPVDGPRPGGAHPGSGTASIDGPIPVPVAPPLPAPTAVEPISSGRPIGTWAPRGPVQATPVPAAPAPVPVPTSPSKN